MGRRYRVTLLGSKKTGKTALCHFMVNGEKIIPHVPTEEIDMRYMQFVHKDYGNCFLEIEDTPGWSAGDRKDDFPELISSVPMTYVFHEDGVKKVGMPPPPDEKGLPWWKFWDDGIVKEPPKEASEEEISALDEQLERRQGFIVVYNCKDPASFKEAEELVAELLAAMEPPDEAAPAEAEETQKIKKDDVDVPDPPIVLVSTHNDLKKSIPGERVDPTAGQDLANGFGLKYFECNAKGVNIKEAFEAVLTAIQTCENNLTFDTAPGVKARCKAQCWDQFCGCCPDKCFGKFKNKCTKECCDKHCCWKDA